MVADNRDAYLPNLATSLWNAGPVAIMINTVTDQAIALTAESVRYFDELTEAEPAVFSHLRETAAKSLAQPREAAGTASDSEPT